MKNSITDYVEEAIRSKPLLEDYLARGLINQSALAREIATRMEKKTGERPTDQSVITAVKRYAKSAEEKNTRNKINDVLAECKINLRSGMADVVVEKTDNIYTVLQDLSNKMDTARGETLSMLHGVSEMAIFVDEKYVYDFLESLKWARPIKVEKNLGEIRILLPTTFWSTPGIIYHITKQMAMRDINVLDLISTTNEVTIMVGKDDAMPAFQALNDMVENAKAEVAK